MIQRLGIALRTPARIHVIRTLFRAAWWLARPSVLGVNVLEHYDLIAEFKIGQLSSGASHNLDRGTLLVNCQEVMTVRSKREQAIDDALESIMNGEHP